MIDVTDLKWPVTHAAWEELKARIVAQQTALATRGDEVDRLKRENSVLKQIIAITDPCIHQQAIEAQEAHAGGRTMSVDEYMASRGLGSDG